MKTRIWSSLLSIAIVVLLLFLLIQPLASSNNYTRYAFKWWKSDEAHEAKILYDQDKVVASWDGEIKVFDLNDGSLIVERKFPYYPFGSPTDVLNGSGWIVYADRTIDFSNETSEMHKVYLLDPNTLNTIMTIDAPYHYHDYQNTWPREFWEVSGSPNGKLVAFGGVGNLLTVYDVENNNIAKVFHLDIDAVGRIVWSPDSKNLLVGSTEWNNSMTTMHLELLNFDSGDVIKSFVNPSPVFSYSINGSMIAIRTANLTISIFDSSSFEVLYEFSFPPEDTRIWGVTWSSTSKWFAVGLGGCVKRVEVKSGEILEKIDFQGKGFSFRHIATSPNDEYLVNSGYTDLLVFKKILKQPGAPTLVLLTIMIPISIVILVFIGVYNKKGKMMEREKK